jgi:hypothetical protein
MIHPILAVIAVGGLIYSVSPHVPAGYSLASAGMLWGHALSGMVVSLARLGDFPGRLRMRPSRPLTNAVLRGCKDEASRAGAITHVTSSPLVTGHWSGWEGHLRGIGDLAVPCCLLTDLTDIDCSKQVGWVERRETHHRSPDRVISSPGSPAQSSG